MLDILSSEYREYFFIFSGSQFWPINRWLWSGSPPRPQESIRRWWSGSSCGPELREFLRRFPSLSHVCTWRSSSKDHAEPRSSRLLPAVSEIHVSPDPMPIEPRHHRQSPSVRELRTRKTRAAGSRNVLPRLLTSLQTMWLLDLREPPDERQRKRKRINQ